MIYWETLTTFDPFVETTYLIFSWLFWLYFYTIFSSAHNNLRNFNTVLDEENDELDHKNEMMENILLEIRSILKADERSARKIKDHIIGIIEREPLARLDYVSISDPESLEELDTILDEAIILLAVFFGRTRLIDNIMITRE